MCLTKALTYTNVLFFPLKSVWFGEAHNVQTNFVIANSDFNTG